MLTLACYASSGSAGPQQVLPTTAEAPDRAAAEETISLTVSGMT